MPTRTSTNNPITLYVVNETWENVNTIARKGVHTCLYRGQFDEAMVEEALDELVESWGRVKSTVVGDEHNKALIIELML